MAPTEALILQGIVARLAAATGDAYYVEAGAAYLVDGAQTKLLREMADDRTLYLVEPGDGVFVADTSCNTLVTADAIVTAAKVHKAPELPWSGGFVDRVTRKLEMVADVWAALHGKEIAGATVFCANRNMRVDVDGWLIVQVQVSFEYSEPGA